MAENKVIPGLLNDHCTIKEAVCIDANKIYDSCRDKDCLEDLRVYLTRCGQVIVDKAINVKCRKSEVIWVYIDVEPVPFNRGFFTVDIKFFFKVTLDAFIGCGKPQQVEGLATFDKKVILFGSEGEAKIYSSRYRPDANDPQNMLRSNLPKATVEVVDPICLSAKIVDPCERCGCCCDVDVSSLPEYICKCFDDFLVDGQPQSGAAGGLIALDLNKFFKNPGLIFQGLVRSAVLNATYKARNVPVDNILN